MNCYKCGYDMGEDLYCENCGTDNTVFRSILLSSARAYNEGLEYAKIRNLTGAVASLSAALRFSKYNTAARNLLGLVYFEQGDMVLALREWVISENLDPEGNEAAKYLGELEYGQGLLEKYDSNNRKYNLALTYLRQGNRDLSKIQLRRVLKNQPKMVKAHVLLALLLMQEDNYEEARKELNTALRIDSGNPLAISYLNEVHNVFRERNDKKKKKKKKDPVVSFQDGNDTVVVPKQSIIETLDSSKGGIFNVLIGLLIGVLATVFLIVPEVRERDNSAAKNALIDVNQSYTDSQQSIDLLQSEVASLKERLSAYEGQADLKQSYENLISAMAYAASNDFGSAENLLSSVNRELLDANGQKGYDSLTKTISEGKAKEAFEKADGERLMGYYDSAAADYRKVVDLIEDYAEGEAIYYLAFCLEKDGNKADALTYYKRTAELFPSTQRGRAAAEKVLELSENETGRDRREEDLT